jgi:hypothetical protein
MNPTNMNIANKDISTPNSTPNPINLQLDITKKICLFSFILVILIILFVLSPFNQFIRISFFIKIIVLFLLGYTIFLSFLQTNILKTFFTNNHSPSLNSSLNINILFSYVFTLFLAILFLFILRNMIFG